MLLGIDFDNTLVCYDELFHRAAVERGWIEAPEMMRKRDVRDALRRAGREEDWTELQGYVYGELIRHAAPFPGVREFFATARERGLELCIISHKTRRPYLGVERDLRRAALDWLHARRLVSAAKDDSAALPPDRVFFEDTKEDKLRRIARLGCTHFIDDLPEFLAEPGFPQGVRRILFDSTDRRPTDSRFECVGDWRRISAYFFGKGAIA